MGRGLIDVGTRQAFNRPMNARGITTSELMVTLAIAGILAGTALPAMTRFHQQQQSTVVLNQLIGAVQFTRHAAITHRAPVTLCPSADAAYCAARDHWHEGAIAFVDENANGRRDPGERLLRVFGPLPSGTRVYWRSFRNRSYLQMMPTGMTNWQNGSFLYCPADGDARHARSLIVNAQGRVRTARDLTGDGIANDAAGQPLACP
jgi:type IV fimbrial biogenesis protein FimT